MSPPRPRKSGGRTNGENMTVQLSRRSLITGLVSFVAAPAIVRVANIMPVKSMEEAEIILGAGDRMPYLASPLDIASVVRRAFVPRLYVQIWKDNPMMLAIQQEIEAGATA
jgi:hypothetical protein